MHHLLCYFSRQPPSPAPNRIGSEREPCTYSSTSFRCTVFVPPQSGIVGLRRMAATPAGYIPGLGVTRVMRQREERVSSDHQLQVDWLGKAGGFQGVVSATQRSVSAEADVWRSGRRAR